MPHRRPQRPNWRLRAGDRLPHYWGRKVCNVVSRACAAGTGTSGVNEGCTNVRQLHAELPDRGYGAIRDYVQPFRELGTAPPAGPAPPKTRDVACWILTDPDHLDDDQKAALAQIRDRCPHLDALARHVTEFAKVLTGLYGIHFEGRLAAVEADDQPDPHSFAAASGVTTTLCSTGSPCPGTQA